jgi:signal transduction histidine kinase
MKRNALVLSAPYQTALRRHLRKSSAASLHSAQRMGRRALTLGVDTLRLAQIHEQALWDVIDALPEGAPARRHRMIKQAGHFFAEAILPLEATHSAALQANERLSTLNRTLRLRTRDLLAANKSLTREIERRRTAQASLRRSEAQSVGLLAQSRRLQGHLRLLSRRVLATQEDERRRISRELHDVVAQLLAGIHVQLALLKSDAATNSAGLRKKISRTQHLVEKSANRVHKFARTLRPALLDDLGLLPALHSFLKQFTKETGIRAHLTAFPGVDTISNSKRTALYRIAQEALTNIARHAHAGRVDVRIRKCGAAVHMRIQDDGRGFEVDTMWREQKRRHLGMLGMRERTEMVGGTFLIESSPGKGTTLEARIPFLNSGERHRST